jgi:undecaprenyl-diphosphatase
MFPVLQAAVLGLIQGVTEFVPISSSGHLVLAPRLLGWHDPGMAFDVAVHLGTLLALLVYFRREWVALIKGFFLSFARRPSQWTEDMRVAWFLVLASVPAAIAGALLNDSIENHLRTPAWVAVFLLVGAAIMTGAEAFGSRSRSFDQLRARDAGVVGVAQVLALVPGTSRSGITISAGMYDGLKREAAAKFAFLMAAPITAGAGLWEAQKLVRHGFPHAGPGVFAVGLITAAVTGFIAIKFMLGYLKHGTLVPFVIYRMALAFLVLATIGLTRS